MSPRLLLLIPSLLLLPSCDSEDAWDLLKTAGPVITEHRPAEPFDRLRLHHWINLELVPDTIEWLTMIGPRNIIADITTEVDQGWLTITDHNTFKWVRGYDHTITLRVGVRTLREIEYQGPANIISLDTLVADTLYFHALHASGDVALALRTQYFHCTALGSQLDMRVSGSTSRAVIINHGTGFLRFGDLVIHHFCWAHNHGGGDITVHVLGHFIGFIEGSGHIFYKGNPTQAELSHRHRGSGQFVPL